MIKVSELLRRHTADDLNRSAEEYFARITDPTYLLAKPFADPREAARVMIAFGTLLQGLRLSPGMRIVDFGAGPCWLSHLLTQMGHAVCAVDVSLSALGIGQERYRQHPPFGTPPAPEFLVYDGRRIPLPDASVDRVVCFDAFHHVPNPEEALAEMARVLKADGIAGFAEPGPDHSLSPEAQAEMETHAVLENDIVIEDIWAQAQKAGFQHLELATASMEPTRLGWPDYQRFLAGPSVVDGAVVASVRYYARAGRLFFLHKEEGLPDSTHPDKLGADLSVTAPLGLRVAQGEPFVAAVRARNNSGAVWLPHSAFRGAVHLGVGLQERPGGREDPNYFRASLTPGDGVPVRPGEEVAFDVRIPSPGPGSWDLTFDLVSEDVAWFASSGSRTVTLRIEVAPA